MNRVQRYLPVGEWKVVDTVKITGAGGQYRPTKQQYKMTILGDTSITPSDYRNDNQFLDLANYEDIVNGKLKPNFLIGMYTTRLLLFLCGLTPISLYIYKVCY